MKYVSANDVLPEELLSMIQKYYQGGYLYIPKENYCEVKQQTDYKIELEKRNQHIYLKHLEGWICENLANNGWKILCKEEYSKTVEWLESVYHYLPKQLIHRDVHFGNFLFFEGNLSGYIDFDLSQRNIRIFDICYFLTGLLAEETDDAFTKDEWIENMKAVIAGYESIINLSAKEKMQSHV